MRRPLALLALASLAGAATACGNEPTPAPDVDRPRLPRRFMDQDIAGVRYRLPTDWERTAAPRPGVEATTSGRAVVALWRYPRTEPLPRTDAELATARRELVKAARARDRTLRVAAARPTRIGGAPAVVLTGEGTIRGRRVRLRSTHVYAEGAEVVLDAYAPPADFPRLDARVFEPMARSVRVGPDPLR